MYLKLGAVGQRSKTNRLDQGDGPNSSEQPDTLSNRSSQGRPGDIATNTLQAHDKATSTPWGCGWITVYLLVVERLSD
jgi:hypothetical protein